MAVIDELGRVSSTEYDAAGRAVLTRSPALADGTQAITQTVYDAAGNIVVAIDPLGRQTDFTYDARNRKVRTAGPAVAGCRHRHHGASAHGYFVRLTWAMCSPSPIRAIT